MSENYLRIDLGNDDDQSSYLEPKILKSNYHSGASVDFQ